MNIKNELFKINGVIERLNQTKHKTENPDVFIKDVINGEYYKITNIRLFSEIDEDYEPPVLNEEIIIEAKKIIDLGKG